MTFRSIFKATAFISAISLPIAAHADITREGAGTRREALDEMELAPFPVDAWAGLTNWTNGQPVSLAQAKGSVVLVCTWSSFYPGSHKGLSVAQRMASKYADNGLIVVGVHHKDRFADAQSVASKRRVSFPYAQDEGGNFREIMLVDQDPDFYVIDRAGQLRFADIETTSVEQAVRELVNETEEGASDLPSILEKRSAAENARARQTRVNAQGFNLETLPEVEFAEPDPVLYQIAAWPRPPVDDDNRRSRRDEPQLNTVQLPTEGFHPAEAPKTKGRAAVVYFWHPDFRRTFDSVMPQMDALARKAARDLVVVGVMSPMEERGRRRNDEGRDGAELLILFSQFASTKKLDHWLFMDPGGGLLQSAQGNDRRSSRDSGIARAVVISSDNVVRWFGDPEDPRFQSAVNTVLRVDPGIKARRAAEEAYIRTGARGGAVGGNEDGG